MTAHETEPAAEAAAATAPIVSEYLTETVAPALTPVAASAAELAERLPFVEGRIVSERVLSASGTRIMHLAFAEGKEMLEHKAPVPILIQVIEGGFEFTALGEQRRLGLGGIVHLTAGLPHAVRAMGPSRLLITMLG